MHFYLFFDSSAPLQGDKILALCALLVRAKDGLVDDLLVHYHVVMKECDHAAGHENNFDNASINGEKFNEIGVYSIESLGPPGKNVFDFSEWVRLCASNARGSNGACKLWLDFKRVGTRNHTVVRLYFNHIKLERLFDAGTLVQHNLDFRACNLTQRVTVVL